MRRVSLLAYLIVCLIAAGLQAGVIVPELDDSTAIGDFTAARNGAINEVADITTGEMTLAARFNPDPSQAEAGPVVVIENGGTSNGTGLYLANGNLVFVSKGASGRYAFPTSLNDTDFSNDGTGKSMAVDLGPVQFGAENKVYVSMDLNNGQLFASVNGYPTWYTITGANGGENLDGNRTVGFLGADPITEFGWMGGLLEAAEAEFPFLFWTNAVAMVQTAGYTSQRGQVFDAAVMPLALPHDPAPADGATNVDPDVVTALSFYTGEDPENPGTPNPDITGHWVTVLATVNGEPNVLEPPLAASPLIPAGPDPIAYTYTFSEDQTVFWQVEEQILGAPKGDPNNIVGQIWSFESVPSVPSVTVSPADVLRFPATHPDYEGPAVLTCEFTSKSQLTAVEWYRSDDPNNPISDADADITISLDQTASTYTSTLSIANVALDDEDSYWCYVQNTAGEDTSETATLGVKRQVARWTLDQADLVGGQYLDTNTDDPVLHHADPNVVPGSAAFVDGADPTETGDGLDLTAEPLAAADSGVWSPALYTGQLTVSAWVNWAGPNGAFQGIVCGRNNQTGVNSWFFEINQGGTVQANAPGYNPFGTAMPAADGNWVHLALTAGNGTGQIYINGQEAASSDNYAVNPVEVPIYLGSTGRPALQLVDTFNGALDDVRIYNYALAGTEVVDLYYDVLETPTCLNPQGVNLDFDVAGGGVSGDEPDCRIGLADFAVFAANWLNCGLYPVCP